MVIMMILLILLMCVEHVDKMTTQISTEAFFDPFVNITLLCHIFFTMYNPPTSAVIFQRAMLSLLSFIPL
jgi:hypothetical protein